MMNLRARPISIALWLVACGGDDSTTPTKTGNDGDTGTDSAAGPDSNVIVPVGPNGNPNGMCAVPSSAVAEDTSKPTTVVGDGTAASCTGDKVAAAVHAGGIVTFNCGAAPIVIPVPEIKIFNDAGPNKDGSVTLDGGGKVTLSGSNDHRILYQNTCDQAQHWTSPMCNTQTTPHLVLQNIGFAGGKANATKDVLGGGAVFVGGGTLKIVNARFQGNTQPNLLQDYAGGALYTFNQTKPVTIVNSSFDGNSGCNGGALGSIGTSTSIYNSMFTNNVTLGNGQNPAKPNTPGGGLGGAIYNDGNTFKLTICGTDFENNTAAELGTGTIFMVSNNLQGDLSIDQSTFKGNSNKGSVQTHPSIYVEARDKAGNAGVTITATTFN